MAACPTCAPRISGGRGGDAGSDGGDGDVVRFCSPEAQAGRRAPRAREASGASPDGQSGSLGLGGAGGGSGERWRWRWRRPLRRRGRRPMGRLRWPFLSRQRGGEAAAPTWYRPAAPPDHLQRRPVGDHQLHRPGGQHGAYRDRYVPLQPKKSDNLTATFSEPVQNVSTQTFILERNIAVKKAPPKYVLVDATVTPSADGLTAVLNPVQDLPKGDYRATITTEVTDQADPANALAASEVWTFKVAK